MRGDNGLLVFFCGDLGDIEVVLELVDFFFEFFAFEIDWRDFYYFRIVDLAFLA